MDSLIKSKIKSVIKGVFTTLGFSFVMVGLSGCGAQKPDETAAADITSGPSMNANHKADLVIKVGYENSRGEPFDMGMKRWRDELAKETGGAIILELYPEDELGDEQALMERMIKGEKIISTADAADLYSRGAYDIGICFGPYLFKSWDEAFHLTRSKWYQEQNKRLSEKQGLHIISSTWQFGLRHILSTRPITRISELDGLRIRVDNNEIQNNTWKIYGAEPKELPPSMIMQAFRDKELDAVDLPVTRMYGAGFHNAAKYLLMTGHVYTVTSIITGEEFWNSLTTEQREALTRTCIKASSFYNVVREANEYQALKNMQEQGVTVTYPGREMVAALNLKAQSFYRLKEFRKWTPGLYYKVLESKSLPWTYYTKGGLIEPDK